MSMELVTKFAPYTDEAFKEESKISLLTCRDFDWEGAHTVKIWKISTVGLNDYKRNVYEEEDITLSRYGALYDLNSQVEEMILKKDRSFIFNVDMLDMDETAGQAEAASALSRELREVVIPEVDAYVYSQMVAGAGTTATAAALTKANVYDAILAGSEAMDNAEVPDTDRVIVVPPETYKLLKQAEVFDNTEAAAEMRKLGVVGTIDGCQVVKVPSNRLPEYFGFMIAHPSATVAPIKLEDYGIHNDTPLASGSIVTGRICYDCFVMDNKKKGIYYHPTGAEEA